MTRGRRGAPYALSSSNSAGTIARNASASSDVPMRSSMIESSGCTSPVAYSGSDRECIDDGRDNVTQPCLQSGIGNASARTADGATEQEAERNGSGSGSGCHRQRHRRAPGVRLSAGGPVVSMRDSPNAGLSQCGTVSMRDSPNAGLSQCGTVPMRDCLNAGLSQCGTVSMRDCPNAGLSQCGTVPITDHRARARGTQVQRPRAGRPTARGPLAWAHGAGGPPVLSGHHKKPKNGARRKSLRLLLLSWYPSYSIERERRKREKTGIFP